MSPISKAGLGVAAPHESGARKSSSRKIRLVAGLAVASVAVAGVSLVGGQGAGAVAAPQAQSVGRFLDGALGGNAIQQLADVADARATAPGTQSDQNPLDVTLLNALELPLTGALQLPSLAGINLGAANQVAVAHVDGFSYGASGAVNNSGGVSVGGDNAAYPANATIDLSAAALGGGTIPIPGGDTLAALGSVKASIGAVSALAQTAVGGKPATTNYNIAGLTLEIGSPALGGLLTGVSGQLGSVSGLLQPVISLLGAALPQSCVLTAGSVPTSISLADGAVVITPATATIAVDVEALLQALGLDLNNLPPNTDLLAYVLQQLPTILGTGLGNVISGLVTPLTSALSSCITALGPLSATLGQLLGTVTSSVSSLTSQLGSLLTTVTDGLGPITDALGNVIAIGVNVQPNGAAGSFTSALKATPNQATPVIAGQTIVRAIEVKLFGGQVASLALANAAAGPSTAAPASSTPASSTPAGPTSTVNTNIPTGVPAGQAGGTGSPVVPLVLLTVGLAMAAAGAVAWKVRGAHVL